ncbi:DUF1254 domain-containing protein [Streptomyces sp. SYSU K21746]
MDLDVARRTAAEGWIWGLPLLENYRTMYAQAVDPADARPIDGPAGGPSGGFGRFRHSAQALAPAGTDSDLVQSWAWLDLRAEPWVVSVPATDRYYVLPFQDLDTAYAGFIGSRTTGQGAGDYLVAGPGFIGVVPPGIDGVVQADTYLVGVVGRTDAAGPPAGGGQQEKYELRSLSTFLDIAGPHPAPEPVWPVWQEESLSTVEFFTVLDFLLAFFPVLPNEAELRGRLAALGVTGSGEFEPAALPPGMRDAIEAGIGDARTRLADVGEGVEGAAGSTYGPGTRAQQGDDYLARAVAAHRDPYQLPAEEAWSARWTQDSEGNRPPDASRHDYTVRFPPGQLPPGRFFWSATLYGLPDRLPVAHAIDRHSIGDRTPGLVHDADGGLTLYVQRERPLGPAEAANWLPAPDGPFTLALRVYGPEQSVLDGSWTLPALTPRS